MKLGQTIAALVLPVLCVAAGCQILSGLNEDLVLGVPPDGGDDASGGCGHATTPQRPNTPDDNTKDTTFVTAIRAIRFEAPPNAEPLGLDLDRYCSCQGEPPSCIAPSKQDSELSCDLAQGRDNMMPTFTQWLSTLLLFQSPQELSSLFTDFAYLGRWSILMRVSEYNGLADDPKVRVEWIPSTVGSVSPQWNGTDVWPADFSALVDGGAPRYFDTEGFVTKNQLNFSLVEGNIQMTNGILNFGLRFSDSTVTANIQKNAQGKFSLAQGTLAGRIPLRDLFVMLNDFRDHNGAPVCTESPFFLGIRDSFCRVLDIQVGSPQPNKRCDAASFALGFEADAVGGVGAPSTPSPPQNSCPLGKDPLSAFDTAGCPL